VPATVLKSNVAPAPAEQPIDARLILPFVKSVRMVFWTMVRVQTTVLRPHLKTEPAPSYDVSGIIGFSGDVVGSVVVSFQGAAARKLAARFAGSEMELNSPDFADAIGELANMVVGSAKKDLGVAAAHITLPSVIIGAGHVVRRLSDVPCIVIPVQTPVGDFCVEVNIRTVPPSLK